MTIVSVMLVVGVVTHSLFAGVFVGFLLGIFGLPEICYLESRCTGDFYLFDF
jgi:hypothetical protein